MNSKIKHAIILSFLYVSVTVSGLYSVLVIASHHFKDAMRAEIKFFTLSSAMDKEYQLSSLLRNTELVEQKDYKKLMEFACIDLKIIDPENAIDYSVYNNPRKINELKRLAEEADSKLKELEEQGHCKRFNGE